jgi:hypothetical protein
VDATMINNYKNTDGQPAGQLTNSIYLPYLALVTSVFLAYANVYRNEFVFDDLYLIIVNSFLTT